MNRKFSPVLRGIALILTAVLLLPMLFACKNEQNVATGTPSLTVDEEGKLTFLLKLDAKDLQAHAGQVAYLYELTPGETVYDINRKTAILQNQVSSKIRFVFPLTDESGTDRRCNTYLMTFSDGTVYSQPVALSNPQLLATNKAPFPHANTMKGLNAGYAELAKSLHSSHTLISLSAEELLTGEVSMSWYGAQVMLNQNLLEQTDQQVADAVETGMQISMELQVGKNLLLSDGAALLNLLLERYTYEEGCVITGLILKEDKLSSAEETDTAATVERMASLLRVARTALLSRVENGRLYVGAEAEQNLFKQYVTDVFEALGVNVSLSVGVAFYPTSLTETLAANLPAEAEDSAEDTIENTAPDASESDPEAPTEPDRPLFLSDLIDTAEELSDTLGNSMRYAVLGVKSSAEDPELQSALYAYAYRVAQTVGADLFIYQTLVDDETGLYTPDGVARPAAESFALADTSENLVSESLASRLLGEDWSDLKSVRPLRVAMEDLANVGVSDDLGKRFFDFADGDGMGFSAVGSANTPTVVNSESWNSSVLMTAISNGAFGEPSGVRCQISDISKLKDAHVLSANLLPQSSTAENAQITLLLEGTASDGRALTMRSSVTLNCNSWQAVTFHVRGFTSMMDEEAPCFLTLTMEPKASEEPATEEEYHALWLHSFNYRRATPDYSAVLLIGMVLAGFGIGFGVMLILSARRKRRHSDQQA